MKIYFSQLMSHLKSNKLSPIYIVSGDEPWQKNEAVKMVRDTIHKMGHYEREKISFDNLNEGWQQLCNSLYTYSLFTNQRLIELDLQDVTLTKPMSSQLHDYVLNLNHDIILLIKIGKIDEKIAKSDWYKAMDKIATIITIWPISHEHLPQWIQQRAKIYSLSFQPDALTLLCQLVEGNVVAAAQAIEKLYLLNANQPITTQLVIDAMHHATQFSVFDLVDNLLLGNMAKSLQILAHLEDTHIEPTIILWAITREVRLLNDLGIALQKNDSLENLFKKHHLFARRQPIVRHALKRLQPAQCYQLLAHALNVDSVIKGGMAGNIWEALQQFCLRLLQNDIPVTFDF